MREYTETITVVRKQDGKVSAVISDTVQAPRRPKRHVYDGAAAWIRRDYHTSRTAAIRFCAEAEHFLKMNF